MSLATELIPPIVLRAARVARRIVAPPRETLFKGDDALFKRVVSTCAIYGEYGVGASTDWVYHNTTARIVAVDTSASWADAVRSGKDPDRLADRLDVATVDLGPLGQWGRPLDYSRRDAFPNYARSIWQRPVRPDVVLIDGRFRVQCFLTCLLEGGTGLRIIFDDYANRPHYHVVEEFLPVKEYCGRQALFEVGDDLDTDAVARMRDQFAYVMD